MTLQSHSSSLSNYSPIPLQHILYIVYIVYCIHCICILLYISLSNYSPIPLQYVLCILYICIIGLIPIPAHTFNVTLYGRSSSLSNSSPIPLQYILYIVYIVYCIYCICILLYKSLSLIPGFRVKEHIL